MNEEQLRRDIEETLSVEPSPQFLARVRRQLETESRRPRLRRPWKVLTAGLATAAVLTGFATLIEPRTAQVTVPAAAIQPVAPGVEDHSYPLQPAPEMPQPSKETARAVVTRPPQPQVIIDPRETAALQSFLDDVQQRRIDPDGLGQLFDLAEHATRTTRIIPATIVGFEPIVVKPLSVTASDEGGSL